MALTFRLGDGVADFGLDVILTVLGKDEGQAEETHTVKSKANGVSTRNSLFVSAFPRHAFF